MSEIPPHPDPGAELAADAAENQSNADSDPLEEQEETPTESFDDFGLSEPVRRALLEVGYETPMPVQTAVWEPVRAGRDVQVESRTGSGKTAAFGLPIIEKLVGEGPGVACLILAPTRELAKQVAEELKRLSQFADDVDVVAVYGGAAMGPQITALQAGVKIVAGTPGRVLDHIKRGNLKTQGIQTLVLDECDEMLSMGFAEEIEAIISRLPPREGRQNLLFSATIPADIVRIAQRHMTEPVAISLSEDGIGAAEIDHHYYLVNGMARTRDLLKVVLRENPETAIIFCNTRDDTATVARNLAKNGFDAEALSGDLSQRERERVMKRMRAQEIRFLVATDIAARGIDISDLSHVINYQFPESAEVYIHRTGRTGRAGKKGTALSLVGPRELGSFYYLKLIYKIRPVERDLPPTEELKDMLENHQLDRVTKLVTEKPNEKFVSLAQKLWGTDGGDQIVGALLERLLVAETSVERDRNEKREREDDREPRRSRGRRPERGGGGRDRADRTDRNDRADRSDRGGDEPRRRRRRSAEDDSGEARGNSDGEASEAESVALKSEATGEGNGETTASAEGDGEGPKRKRRRRRRGGRGRDSRDNGDNGGSRERTASASADDGKEFWETWADEKSPSAEDGSEPASDEERAPAEARAPREERAPREADEDQTGVARLYVNIGKREEATADDIRELIGGLIGEQGTTQIDSVALRNTHSYVRVPDELVEGIIKASEGQAFRERELLIERARR